MKDAILRKARESADLQTRFFEENVVAIEACVRALAARFRSGGRLITMGNGGSACDAAHVAVEFVHPIIEKRRPLPALSLTGDTATLTAIANDTDFARVFVDQLELLARPGWPASWSCSPSASPAAMGGECPISATIASW